MNQAKVRILAGSFLSLLIILLCISQAISYQDNLDTQKFEQATESYAETHSFTYQLGETVTLNYNSDKEGESYSWVAGFDWSGTLEATLNEVKIYKQNQFDQLNSKYLVNDDMERQLNRLEDPKNPLIVCYQLTLHSIDATPENGNGFSIQTFSLNGDAEFASYEPIYIEGTYYGTKKYDETNGYKYTLAKGETKTITIGYLVGSNVKDTELSLAFGQSNTEKYAVKINPSEIKEAK